MSFTAGNALAQSCSTGGCGGPSELEQAIAKVEAAESTVSNADLQTAYDKIEQVAEQVDELNVGSSSKVRGGLKKLAGKLEERTATELEDAIELYFNGYHDEALAKFEELSELTGLPSAKKAQKELDKEEDRVAWRLASEQATKFIDGKQYADARMPLNDMQRLARRTGYTDQTDAQIEKFTEQLLPVVEAGEEMIEREQYVDAYAMLIEVSRLTHARESAIAARRVLGKNARIDGMRLAKAEYEATGALANAKDWYAEIVNPSDREQEQYQQRLQAIAKSFKGTSAAEQAEQMLLSDNAQAAR